MSKSELLDEWVVQPILCNITFKSLKERAMNLAAASGGVSVTNISNSDAACCGELDPERLNEEALIKEFRELFFETIIADLESHACYEIIKKIQSNDKLDGFNTWVFQLQIGVVSNL